MYCLNACKYCKAENGVCGGGGGGGRNETSSRRFELPNLEKHLFYSQLAWLSEPDFRFHELCALTYYVCIGIYAPGLRIPQSFYADPGL